VNQQILVAEGCAFARRLWTIPMSRSSEHARAKNYRLRKRPELTDRQSLRATLLGDPQSGLRLYSTAWLSTKSNIFPIAHINSGEGQYLRDLDHIADEDAAVIFVGTATNDPRTVKQAWNARLPKMARIVGGV
jgi:hypothetical protein